jgi:hypothetical protein
VWLARSSQLLARVVQPSAVSEAAADGQCDARGADAARSGGGHIRGDAGEHVGRYPIAADTAEGCKALCDGEPACLQYVFHIPSKNCYRMNRVYEDADNNENFASGRCKRGAWRRARTFRPRAAGAILTRAAAWRRAQGHHQPPLVL